ncbi:MAG: MerC family mercury resistance protein [Gammaproteobacteria bacterium]|nr:MerC family mercury resistance protein [Gammaproteobacteria bacterium]
MNNLQTITDKTAICLSLLCAVHCLAMPLAAVLLPSIVALPLADEVFHLWMLTAVLPISAYALTMGCRKHKRYRLLSIGGMGLLILSIAAFGGHERLGEIWEKTLTVIGAVTIALGHAWNYRLCQHQDKSAAL